MNKINQLPKVFFWLTLMVFQIQYFEAFAQNCTVNAGPDKTICLGSNFDLNGSIGGPFNSNSLSWSVVSQPVGSNILINNPNSVSTSAGTSLLSGNYTFRLTSTCGDNITVHDDVIITVAPSITFPTIFSPFTFNCYNGSAVSLTGASPAAGETVTWTVAGLGGTLGSPNASTTTFTPNFPLDECSSAYRVSISYTIRNTATGCTRTNTSTFTFVRSYPFSATVEPNPVCGTSTVLKGSCPGAGTSAWTLVSKPSGASDPTIVSASNRISSVTGLVPGNYVFRYTVTGGCNPGTADVNVTVASGSGVTMANAGKDQYFCSMPNLVSLSGNAPAVGESVQWSKIAGNTTVTFSNATNANTTASGLTNAGAPYAFLYTVSTAGGCSTKDTVNIYVEPSLTLRVDQLDACTPTSVAALDASDIMSLGNFSFNQLDTVKVSVTYVSGPAATIRPVFGGGSSFNSLFVIASNSANISIGQTITQSFWNTGNTITANELYMNRGVDPNSNTYFLRNSFALSEIGVYNVIVTYETKCSTYVSNVKINRGYGVASVTAGTDIKLSCGSNTATLAGSLANGFGYWQTVTKPSGSSDPITSSNFTQRNPVLNGLINGTYVFRYYNNAGATCFQGSDDVALVVSSVPPATPNAGADQNSCAGTVALSGSAIPDGALAQWTVVSPVGASVTFSDATIANPRVSGLLPNTSYTFRYTLSNGCGNSFDDVVINTNANTGPSIPVLSSSSANCSYFPIQGSFPRTYNFTFNHQALSGSQTGSFSVSTLAANALTSWSQTGSTATSKTIQFTLNKEASVAFIFCVSDAVCATQTVCDTMSYTFFSNFEPSTSAGLDQNLCSVTSFPTTTSLNGAATNVPVKWSLVYSSNGQGVAFSNPNSPTSTVTLPAMGTYRLKYEIQTINPECSSLADYVDIVVSTPGSLAQAGNDTTICNTTGVFNLNATPLAVGTGAWTVESVVNGVTPLISSPSSATSQVTFTQSGTAVLRWSSYGANVSCGPSSYDLVTLTYIAPARAGADQTFCQATSTTLTATNPAPATGTWSQISGPATATISSPSSVNTVVSGLSAAGTYAFVWTVSNAGACTTRDTVLVTRNLNPTTANAGTDIVACLKGATSVTLAATAAGSGNTGTWSVFSVPSGANATSFSNVNSPTATFGPLSVNGDYILAWTVSNGNCSLVDYVTINYPQQANAGRDSTVTICDNNTSSYTLANLITGEQSGGVWSRISGSGGTFNAGSGTFAPAPGTTSSVFQYIVAGNAPCGNDTSFVYFNISAQAYAGTDGSTTVCDNSTATIILADLISGEQSGGYWVWTSGIGGIVNFDLGTYQPVPGSTTSTFLYIVNGVAPCPNDTSVVTINVVPRANAGSDGSTSVCDNSGVTITLSNLISGQQAGGTWVRLSGTGGTFNAINGTYLPASGATSSNFAYVVSGTSPCGNDTSIVAVTINACLIQITGTVFYDVNGNTVINAGENGTTAGTNLYVYLVNSSGVVVDSAKVNANGTYTLDANQNQNYTIELSTVQYPIGTNVNTTPIVNTPPSGWVTIGENGTNNSGSGDLNPNGVLAVSTGSTNVSNQNFAIAQPPVADAKTYVGLDPTNLRFVPTNNATYPNGMPLSNATSSFNGPYTSVSGELPGRVSGNDPASGLISGATGSNGSMTFVTDGKLYDPNNSNIQLNNTVLVYQFEGENLILSPNPSPSNPAYIFWNLATSKYEIPDFNANNLSAWFDAEGQTGFTFNYSWINEAGLESNVAPYTVNATGPLAILPVELTAFDVIVKDRNVILNWSTASEKNNDRFEIERSVDGINFETIGSVKGNGTTSIPHVYTFTDLNPGVGQFYYRLKQVDYDDQFEYSQIKFAEITADVSIKVFPNPASNYISIQINNDRNINSKGMLVLYNAAGAIMLTDNFVGSVQKQLDVSQLPTGNYLLSYHSDEIHTTIKVIITH